MIYYIADWHYDHANIIHFDNRPFKTCEDPRTLDEIVYDGTFYFKENYCAGH